MSLGMDDVGTLFHDFMTGAKLLVSKSMYKSRY